jgi:fused signal recognition particle receptor
MLPPATPFRAAAIDQLKVWGDGWTSRWIAHLQGRRPRRRRLRRDEGRHARDGRRPHRRHRRPPPHKHNLMAEWASLRGIVQKTVPDAPQETILVIDATTGQNGLVQAKEFSASVAITDILIAKLDGTAKGGIAFSSPRNWAPRSLRRHRREGDGPGGVPAGNVRGFAVLRAGGRVLTGSWGGRVMG